MVVAQLQACDALQSFHQGLFAATGGASGPGGLGGREGAAAEEPDESGFAGRVGLWGGPRRPKHMGRMLGFLESCFAFALVSLPRTPNVRNLSARFFGEQP